MHSNDLEKRRRARRHKKALKRAQKPTYVSPGDRLALEEVKRRNERRKQFRLARAAAFLLALQARGREA